jgi:hypothetical protein
MTRITQEAATEYVTKMETKWYGQPYSITKIEPSREEPDFALDVYTTENYWTVWLEDGEAYGEC